MNFTYTLIKPPDGQWGAIQSDGSWSGTVNLLANEIIDIGVTDFTITKENILNKEAFLYSSQKYDFKAVSKFNHNIVLTTRQFYFERNSD